ncbi:MAG: glycosyltransferase family 2 protein [Chloroflexota bacterium]
MNTSDLDYASLQAESMATTDVDVYLSVVVPIYNEVENIPDLHRQLRGSLDGIGRSYEIIYVDDGSRDGSFDALAKATYGDRNARVIQFRRNFGQTAAISAGIAQSRGEVVMMMDGDLQNDPNDIPLFLEQLDAGHDVVSGWRRERHDAFLSRKLPSRLANWLISRVTGVYLHDYGCTLKAYRREVISEVQLYGEMHRFIPAFASHVGASVAEIPVNHRPRIHGTSKYGMSRTGRVLLDLMVVKFLGSYATKPIYVFGGMGILSIIGSIFTLLILLWGKLFNGWYFIQSPLLLLTALLLIIGVQLLLMGLLAELLMRTYHETRHKPIYHIRRTLNVADHKGDR